MFFRVLIVANFPQEPTHDHVVRLIDYLRNHATNINAGQPNVEHTTARIELCHHDETPGAPCTLVREWQLPNRPR